MIKMKRMITMTESEYLTMQRKAEQSKMDADDFVYRSEAGAYRQRLDVMVINLLIHGAPAECVLRDCVGIDIGDAI
jgi:hypothetical protein